VADLFSYPLALLGWFSGILLPEW